MDVVFVVAAGDVPQRHLHEYLAEAGYAFLPREADAPGNPPGLRVFRPRPLRRVQELVAGKVVHRRVLGQEIGFLVVAVEVGVVANPGHSAGFEKQVECAALEHFVERQPYALVVLKLCHQSPLQDHRSESPGRVPVLVAALHDWRGLVAVHRRAHRLGIRPQDVVLRPFPFVAVGGTLHPCEVVAFGDHPGVLAPACHRLFGGAKLGVPPHYGVAELAGVFDSYAGVGHVSACAAGSGSASGRARCGRRICPFRSLSRPARGRICRKARP